MDEIDSVEADDVRRYLSSLGWTRTKADELKDIWSSPTEHRVLLPEQRLADYTVLVEEALLRLARAEGRPVEDVLVEIEYPSYDKLVARTRADRQSPAVPLQDALGLHGALRDLVVASARASERPQASFRGGWSNAVGSYVDHVRMLPARPGSFALRALLPLNTAEPDELLLPTVTTTSVRRVTRTLMTAVGAARSAAEARAGGESDDVFVDSVESGVSADLLDALVRLGGPDNDVAPVELAVSWTYAAPEEPLEPVALSAGLMPVLAHGADVLRGTPDEVSATVTGLVVRLHRHEKLGPGEVTIQGFVESSVGSSTRQVRAELDEVTYGDAIAAHRDGSSVRVRCVVRFGGARLEVTHVESFDVTND